MKNIMGNDMTDHGNEEPSRVFFEGKPCDEMDRGELVRILKLAVRLLELERQKNFALEEKFKRWGLK